MIALTQEKRQKRIEWLKDRISSMEQCRDEIPFGLSEDESMELSAYKDSLASLTAEFKTVRLFGDYGEGELCWVECDPLEEGAQKIYSAPPVPEIKLPEYEEEQIESIWNDALDEVKRLNRLEE
ncbi:hypothetical protein [Rosenbergiella collisarenosi]|uniref:hypothetical protein n=1 Tax=Rosenbergiella collisarenosi TaxID=1544695 RepID=UPI001F4F4046|nr:hypothetical protein [Rosenbergiella collisarenosi]